MHRYRIRPAVAVGTCAPVPLLFFVTWVLIIGFMGSWGLGLCAGLASAGVLFTLSYRRVRRRTLTVNPDGLEVQRDQYRLIVPWTAIDGVQNRRHQRVMAVEELVVTGAAVVPLDHRGQPTSLPQQLVAGHPAPTRVMVSLYDKNWRHGPIGQRLREDRVLSRSGVPGDSAPEPAWAGLRSAAGAIALAQLQRWRTERNRGTAVS